MTKHSLLTTIASLLLFCLLLPIIAACNTRSNEFERRMPKPQWWDRVPTEVEIETYSDLLAFWQKKDRKPEAFFKAAYLAAEKHYDEPEIAATAISLMPYGDPSYPHVESLLEYGVEHYFHFKRSLANYSGKPGDTTANIVEKLASLYVGKNEYEKAIQLVERLFRERKGEVNDQLLELITSIYAEALFEKGDHQAACRVLEQAIADYHGDWEKKLRSQLEKYKSETSDNSSDTAANSLT